MFIFEKAEGFYSLHTHTRTHTRMHTAAVQIHCYIHRHLRLFIQRENE